LAIVQAAAGSRRLIMDGYTADKLMSSIKDSIYRIVDSLTEEEAEELLDYLNTRADPDALTEVEMARNNATRTEMKRGEYVTLEDIQRRPSE
jgi:hypothetical protein